MLWQLLQQPQPHSYQTPNGWILEAKSIICEETNFGPTLLFLSAVYAGRNHVQVIADFKDVQHASKFFVLSD